jgi:hypothetical protein
MDPRATWVLCAVLGCVACADDAANEDDTNETDAGGDAGHAAAPDAAPSAPPSADTTGSFLALTYNVAGLPMGLSSSMPEIYTPLIGPLLNDYELVLLQESWLTPDPNPGAPSRVYHEILVEASDHPYQSEPAGVPWGMDPDRPSALLGDGLNMFADFPFGETERVRWPTCVESASDCLALKGFSMARMELRDGVTVDVYNLHMEAGSTPEDDEARDLGIDTMVAFMADRSAGQAILVGGDFNLHTDEEPAASQFARLLDEAGLTDACTDRGCDRPGSIDKFLFRSSDELAISVESHRFETDVFVTEDGLPLSDHPPLAVRFAWSVVP